MTTSLDGLRVTCPSVPLQIEGPVDGGYVYFRARHGEWQLGIGRDQDSAVEATIVSDAPTAFYGDDPDEAMSSGDEAQARALIAGLLPMLRLPS